MTTTKELKTDVEIEDFKGHPMFKIVEFRPDGQKTDYPLINLSKKKAREIIKHIEALKEFVK